MRIILKIVIFVVRISFLYVYPIHHLADENKSWYFSSEVSESMQAFMLTHFVLARGVS